MGLSQVDKEKIESRITDALMPPEWPIKATGQEISSVYVAKLLRAIAEIACTRHGANLGREHIGSLALHLNDALAEYVLKHAPEEPFTPE